MVDVNKPKVIVNYLPQFHSIPENDKWWGKGYTEWTAVKACQPQFEGHRQPRVPRGGHYYTLDNEETIRWQAELARSVGIYGFGIYHYWFSSKLQLLDKPLKLIRQDRDIDIGYMLIWDNVSWMRTWSNVKSKVSNSWSSAFENAGLDDSREDGMLAELVYGDEPEWKAHFNYLAPYFEDPRYIRLDGKPIFAFMSTCDNFAKIQAMAEYWDHLAKEQGLSGLTCITRIDAGSQIHRRGLEYKFRYESLPPADLLSVVKQKIAAMNSSETRSIRFYDYDAEWRRIIRMAKRADSKTFMSCIVDYDDTPRRGRSGVVMKGATPEKFELYFREFMAIAERQNKPYVFISAWNEWGEGMYLEPDEDYGAAYLDAIKHVLV